MQLKSLEIQGFKSFPDRTRLDFTQGITAVVGPNGSGKSNIVDAVRWVFGEQSTKTLRGAKMEDVIFGGTQTRKPQGFAGVTLIIDNSDRQMPVESDEITISRRLYRSGESEYRLGNAAVRLKDVYELFLDTGLGRDGYSIIGQGKIAEIVSTKSKERREIFEEAAGIAKYRYRKGEAERRLEQAEENLLRLRDILLELEGRVEPLRKESEKATQFLKLSQEKRVLEISVWMANLERFRAALREQEDKFLIAKGQHDEVNGQLEALEAEINSLFSQMQSCAVQMDELRTRVRGEEESLAQCQSQIAVRENDIAHNSQTVADLTKELTDEAADGELPEQIKACQTAIAARETAGAALAAERKALLQEAETHRDEEMALAAQGERLRSRRAAIYQNIDSAKVAGASSLSLLGETEGRLEALQSGSDYHLNTIAGLEAELSDCKGLLAGAQERSQGLQNSRRGYELKAESRKAKRQELDAQRIQWEDRAKERRQRAKVLLDMERNMEGYAASVRYLLTQAERGQLRGIRGPISRLITVEAKYATAVEIALGGAMQNLVVEDEAAAKAAIANLSSAKQGRATFLPMTSVKGSPLNEPGLEQHAGFVGLCSNLVGTASEYQGIVQWLLGRIVITEDLDSAISMAKACRYRFRIVTLDGQVVNTGGSLTGGYTAKGAGILGRQQEIDRLEEEAKGFSAKAGAIAVELEAAEREIASLTGELWGIDADLRTAAEDHIRAEGEEKRLEFLITQAKRTAALAQKEEVDLRERLATLRTQNLSAEELLTSLTGQLAQVEGELLTLSERQREALAAGGGLKEALSQLELRLLGEEKDREALVERMEHLRQQAENRERRRQELESRIQTLGGENEALALRIEALTGQGELHRQSIAEATKRMEEAGRRRDDCQQRATQERSRSQELTARRENLSREVARLEERRLGVQGEYDSILTKLWDEYEMTRTEAEEVAVRLEDLNQAQRTLQELRSKIKNLGSVNVAAIEEYEEVSTRYRFLKTQVEDVERSRQELTRLIGELTTQMKEIFLENFHRIGEHFSQIFTELFGGGKASLSLSDEGDVLESGVEISVQPPGKLIKNLAALSGGEQAFVAIAIYFAILRVNPAPFCILDEIEAALDDVNVTKYAQYLRKMTGKTQFIAITHRRGTMEEADVLYGVTMQEEGVSKLLELKVTELEQKLGIS